MLTRTRSSSFLVNGALTRAVPFAGRSTGQGDNKALIASVPRALPDAKILSTYPSLTLPDLEAAWDYLPANREEIERAIRENEEGDDGPAE